MDDHGYILLPPPQKGKQRMCLYLCIRVRMHKHLYVSAQIESLKASKIQHISVMEQQEGPSGPFGFLCLKLLLRQIILPVSEGSLNLVLNVSMLFGFSQVNPGCHSSTVIDVLLRDLQLCIMGLKSLPVFFTLLSESCRRVRRSHWAFCKGVAWKWILQS